MLASMFVPSPENVIELEVAISPPVESVPETSALPWTDKSAPGVVEPIPTLPAESTRKAVLCATMSLPIKLCVPSTSIS